MGVVREGGCVCGAVRYRIKADPQFGVVCHCTWCQKRSGSAFSFNAYCRDGDIEFNGGARASYEHRSDETGRWLRTEFCPTCGTPVTPPSATYFAEPQSKMNTSGLPSR